MKKPLFSILAKYTIAFCVLVKDLNKYIPTEIILCESCRRGHKFQFSHHYSKKLSSSAILRDSYEFKHRRAGGGMEAGSSSIMRYLEYNLPHDKKNLSGQGL